MSADPWDSPTFTHEPILTIEEFDAIKAEVFDSPWRDPARLSECLVEAVAALGQIATGSLTPEVDATQALRRMLQRTLLGGPLDEPREPTW